MPALTSANDAPTPEATVEVTYADTSDEPSPEITAAHRARQAKRAAARETRSEKRRDFLSNLNSDLLTADQRELHAEYADEHRALREAAARAQGLDDTGVEVLMEDLSSIDSAMGVGRP